MPGQRGDLLQQNVYPGNLLTYDQMHVTPVGTRFLVGSSLNERVSWSDSQERLQTEDASSTSVVSRSSKRIGTCACVLEDVDVSEIARLFALVKI